MKLFFVVLLISVVGLGSKAQQDTANYPYWVEMMQAEQVHLPSVQSAFEKYWHGRVLTKGSGYKPFKRWEYRMSKRVDENGFLPRSGHIHNTLKKSDFQRSLSGNWKPLGPNFNQTTLVGSIHGVGRLNTIQFHPTDPDKLYIGAPAGGLWISDDNGNSYTNMTDDLPTLGVSAILIDPGDPSRIYIGTGDRDADDAEGLGVFISTDGGISWAQSNTGMGDKRVNVMMMHPDSSNIIFAGCQGGMYRSDDSGATWAKVILLSTNFEDFELHPTDHNIMYCVGGSRVYRSTDYGHSWDPVSGLPMTNRMFISVSKDMPNRVYALLTNQRSFYGFYRSDDNGQTFTQISNSPNIMGYETDGSDPTGGQAWYDAALLADPNNGDAVYVAGIHVFKSLDGGQTWSYNSSGTHVDMHYLATSPHTSEIYLCNDGGLYRSDSANTQWTDISANMVVGQMYKVGQSHSDINTVLCGFQDNGTAAFDGVGWTRFTGADGMECMVDPFDNNYWYSTYQYGTIRRSINGGQNSRTIGGTDVNNIDEDGAWVTPYTLAEHTNTTMFAGYQNVWRTTKLKESNEDDVLWEKISNGIGTGSVECSVIEHSPADSNLLYVTKPGSQIFRSDNCNDPAGSVVWTTTNIIGGSGSVTDIECHPTLADVVYMTRGNYVLKSMDRGNSWIDITGNLPAITKTCLTYDTTLNEGLYIGTVAGVYYKDSSMSSWVQFSNGLPATLEITEINIYYGSGGTDKRLRASSYGRGLWESDVYDPTTTNFPATPLISFYESNPKKEVYGNAILNVEFYKNLDIHTVTGFTAGDITVTNGSVAALTINGNTFQLEIQPVIPGLVTVYIAQAAAMDTDSVNTNESTIFSFNYTQDIPYLSYRGPGGVGNHADLSVWLDASSGPKNSFGIAPENSGDPVATWTDKSMHNIIVNQSLATRYPYLLEGNQGINGMNAVGFSPDTSTNLGDYLLAEDIRPGQNFAMFMAAQSHTNPYNNHGWMASARQANGFVLHPVNNSRNIYTAIVDQNNDYWSTSSIADPNPQQAHIHGMAYCENQAARYAMTNIDGLENESYSYSIPGRDDNATINVKLGWDYNERYGDGKIAEYIIYNQRLGKSHYTIVQNYLGAKYQLDQGNRDFYMYDNVFRFNLAGIGRENEFDYHLEAEGESKIRIKSNFINSDSAYMMWADINGDMSGWNENILPYNTKRLNNTWRFDKYGDIEEVEVYIGKNSIPFYTDQVGILLSNTPDFSDGLEVIPMAVYNADTLVAYVDFNKGIYMTIVRGSKEEFKLINEEHNDLTITAYPSLNTGNFEVYIRDIKAIDGKLNIYDLAGKLVYSQNVNGDKSATATIQHLASGSYSIRYETADEAAYTRVVVVKD